jgi:hypothetical protein
MRLDMSVLATARLMGDADDDQFPLTMILHDHVRIDIPYIDALG